MIKKALLIAVCGSFAACLHADISVNVPIDGELAAYASTFELINGSGGNAQNAFTWDSVPDVQVGEASVNWSYTLSAPEGGYFQYIPPAGNPEGGYSLYGISFQFTWQTDNFTATVPPIQVLNFAINFNEASANFGDLSPAGYGYVRRVPSGTGGSFIIQGNLGTGFIPGEVYTFESLTFSATLIAPISQNAAMSNFTGTNGTGYLTGIASTANQFEAPVQPDPGEFFTYVAPVPEPAHVALAGGLIALVGAVVLRRLRGRR
jgi:hypothetical protein